MTALTFCADDLAALEAGRSALHAAGDHDNASQLSWLAARMRTERFIEEAHDLLLERRLAEYGPARVQHLRSVGGNG